MELPGRTWYLIYRYVDWDVVPGFGEEAFRHSVVGGIGPRLAFNLRFRTRRAVVPGFGNA